MERPNNIVGILDKHQIFIDASNIFSGSNDPNAERVQAPVGAVYIRDDGGIRTGQMYVKTESGWKPIQPSHGITQA